MSTTESHTDHPPTSPLFHLFPLLPYELRIEIWRAAFPPHSTHPILRVSAASTTTENEASEISYTFKLITDPTLFHAITSPEYLTSFLTTCIESRDLYIEYFNLTSTLPSRTSIPIYYSLKTTVFIENGIFINPNQIVMETFRSIPTSLVILPPFFNQIQNVALPLSHFNEELLNAYELYSPPTTPGGDWPPPPGDETLARSHEEAYHVPAVHMLGSIFSRLTNLKKLCIVLPDDDVRFDNVLRFSALADAEDVVESMALVFMFFKRDIYPLDGEWEPAEISVFMGERGYTEEEDDSDGYDPSSP